MNGPRDATGAAPQETPVLVVEDSPIQAELVRRLLAQHGYRVMLAANGAEALALARQDPPRVVISDINMPVMDGYEMCRAIREDPALGNLPVILLTMMSDTRDVIRGLNAGADYYVTKPFNAPYLLSRIEAALTSPPVHGGEKVEMELSIGGERQTVRAGRQQAVNLLVSTYENAVLQNRQLQSVQEQLNTLNHRLEEANKNLESFAYSVSHDLRTPLRAIEGFSEMLLKTNGGRLDEEGRHLMDRVLANSRKLRQLIDDLLAFSRMSRQGMAMAEVDMGAMAREVYAELQAAAGGRHLAVQFGALPAAWGDHAILRQVWVNLLSNAIKFTRRQPAAKIEVGGCTEGAEHVYFVKDNGAGFDMQYADRLFGVFQRLHTEEEFEGTGIGLAIVKRIVTRHGGRVWAQGEVGKGAAFYFALPAEGASSSAPA